MVTIIITVSKVVDAILDPVMGSIIDMTRTRWGKLRPYIPVSPAAPVALLSGLLFTVPDTAEPLSSCTGPATCCGASRTRSATCPSGA